MYACIISTAQQARPKVIGHSDPVRAQFTSLSICATTKPRSDSSSVTAFRAWSWSAPGGSGCETRAMVWFIWAFAMSLLPLQRALLPLVDETHGQHAEEDHHRPEAEHADLAQRNGPGEQKRHFQVENDEQDRDQVESDVELPAGIVECLESAFVRRQFLRIGVLPRQDQGRDHHDPGQTGSHDDEYQDRQIFAEKLLHSITRDRPIGERRRPPIIPTSRHWQSRERDCDSPPSKRRHYSALCRSAKAQKNVAAIAKMRLFLGGYMKRAQPGNGVQKAGNGASDGT